MTSETLFRKIEDFAFSARVDVASGVRVFLRIAFDQPEVIQLQACIEQEEDGCLKIWERAFSLCSREVDAQYANPWDVPIAIYLYIIKESHLENAYILAHVVKAKINLLWARQIALDIISEVDNSNKMSDPHEIFFSVRQKENRREYQVSSPSKGIITATSWYHLREQPEPEDLFNQLIFPGVALNG